MVGSAFHSKVRSSAAGKGAKTAGIKGGRWKCSQVQSMSAVFDSVCCILVLFTILSYAIDEGVIDCGSSISKYVQFNIS